MKKLCIILTVLTALCAGWLNAQEARIAAGAEAIAVPAVPCPRPVSTTLKGATPPTSEAADLGAANTAAVAGSQWNQTAINKHFAYTFRFPAPPRECCLMTSGTLTVRIKALQGGSPGSPTSVNDAVHIMSNGTAVAGLSQQPWLGGVATGTIATLNFNIPAAVLKTGRVTFYVQDDAAVLDATLTVRGCCLQ